ncbi:MAG: glycosyltransferase family 39 protein [Pyrinomonadaceae bacterium]|nr:glycosyltransferase family 39 protein [Pyrinomonadaceae bacterium]
MNATRSIAPVKASGLRQLTFSLLRYWPVFLLCSLTALALLWQLGKSSLLSWDEAIYAQVSKEMVQSGNWLTPHWQYKPWFHKPPLLMWLTAIFFSLFGISEFWSRAASAFSGIGVIVTTYLVGKFVYDTGVGFSAAVVLLTSVYFVEYARFGTIDIMLTLFTLLAVYAYLRLGQGSQRWWYIIFSSCALAVMAKGTAGVIAPAAIGLALLLDRRLAAALRSRHFWQGLLLAFAIVAPWHIIMYMQHGQRFLSEYLGFHVIARATRALEGHTGGRFYYIVKLQNEFSPWFYLVPFVLASSINENIKGRARSRLLLLVTVLVFALYTSVQTKLDWYILPLCPALAILVAAMLVHAIKSSKSIEFSGLVVAACAVALIAPVKIVLAFGCLGLLVVILCLATKKLAYQPAAVVMCAFLVVVGLNTLRPIYRRGEEPVARLARIAGSTNPGDREPLIVFLKSEPPASYSHPAALFYSNRPILLARNMEDVASFTKDHQIKRIITDKEDLESLSMNYEVHVEAESKPDIYATIKLNSDR